MMEFLQREAGKRDLYILPVAVRWSYIQLQRGLVWTCCPCSSLQKVDEWKLICVVTSWFPAFVYVSTWMRAFCTRKMMRAGLELARSCSIYSHASLITEIINDWVVVQLQLIPPVLERASWWGGLLGYLQLDMLAYGTLPIPVEPLNV